MTGALFAGHEAMTAEQGVVVQTRWMIMTGDDWDLTILPVTVTITEKGFITSTNRRKTSSRYHFHIISIAPKGAVVRPMELHFENGKWWRGRPQNRKSNIENIVDH